MDLRDYQRKSVDAVWAHMRARKDNPCVVLPTAAGKSVVLAEICRQAISEWGGRVLVLTHVKELVEQNAAKLRQMLPAGMVGIHSAGLKKRDYSNQVIAAGIQSVYRKACDLGRFDLVVIDECFPAGTLIDTPRGEIPIEDLYVGQPVHHAFGVGDIEAISSRPAYETVKLGLNNGKTIECTPNHRFFTESGWCEASALAVGARLFSREDVSCLRKGILSEHMEGCEREAHPLPIGNGMEDQSLLLSGLPANGSPPTQNGTLVIDEGGSVEQPTSLEIGCTDGCQGMSLLRKGVSAEILRDKTGSGEGVESAEVLLTILFEESRQPDVCSDDCRKSQCEAQGNRPQASVPRREWGGADSAAGNISAKAGSGNRVFGIDSGTATQGGGVQLLQTGCGDPIDSPWNSTERQEPYIQKGSQNGQACSQMAGGIRVVSIVHNKLESPRVVYNLQIAEHPSYYADGVLVHNCHLMPPGDDGEGMYRSFLADAKIINPALRVIGLTATPYRMSSGEICGPDNVLNHVCYEVGVRDLIEAGYLSPLVSKGGARKADVSGLHIRGGEFIAGEAEDLMDADELVKSAVAEIVEATRDRKSCLIFCAGIRHAAHVVKAFRDEHGIECGFVEGNTPSGERARLISRFRGELQQQALFAEPLNPLKYLANVGVLTTGFDAPGTDCVALLRPTASAGLFYQMLGRGFRLAPGKESCLILDFAENLVRHGPVDMLRAGDRPNKGVPGEAPARECPKCRRICHASVRTCPECGFEFPKNENPKHNAHASDAPVISGGTGAEPREFVVLETSYIAHVKRNAPPGHPPSMRVSHRIGGYDNWVSEWVCPQHTGYAREKFIDWWAKRSHYPPPRTVRDAVAMAHEGCLASTSAIRVKQDANGYNRIIAWALGEKPDVDRGLLEAIHNVPIGEPWPVGNPATEAGNTDIDLDDIPF